MSEESRKQTFPVQPLCTYDCLFVIYTALCTVPQMIPNRKWSWDRKWSPDGPQMTLDRKWSLKSTANDSVKTWAMEWILWDWLQKRTDYTKETFFSRLLKKKGRRTLQLRSIHTSLVASSFPFSLEGERKRFLFYNQSFFVISPIKSIPFLKFTRDHLGSTLGITCGGGSFAVHFRLGIVCGTVQDSLEPWLDEVWWKFAWIEIKNSSVKKYKSEQFRTWKRQFSFIWLIVFLNPLDSFFVNLNSVKLENS